MRNLITAKDEADLMWFFGAVERRFLRSTMGPMLSHAENRAFNSENKRHKDGADAANPWPYMTLNETTRTAGYTIGDELALRSGL